MTSQELKHMPTTALVEMVLFRRMKTAKEDCLVKTELDKRYLTPVQKVIVSRYFTPERCQYNYDAIVG